MKLQSSLTRCKICTLLFLLIWKIPWILFQQNKTKSFHDKNTALLTVSDTYKCIQSEIYLVSICWLENYSHLTQIQSIQVSQTKSIFQCSLMMLSRFVQNSGFSLIKFQPRLQNANLNNSKLLYSLKIKALAFKVEIYLSFFYKTKKYL